MTKKRAIWTIVAAAVGVFALVWGGFALSVAMSGPKGVGDAIKTKNSAQNWTAAQARFEKQYQSILAADQKIGVHRAALAARPDDPTLQTNLTGITTTCISAVADYNAESRKFLSADFKAADLPFEIDQAATATDCK
jgi:hypothetical protein